jgi:hypothetical protein
MVYIPNLFEKLFVIIVVQIFQQRTDMTQALNEFCNNLIEYPGRFEIIRGMHNGRYLFKFYFQEDDIGRIPYSPKEMENIVSNIFLELCKWEYENFREITVHHLAWNGVDYGYAFNMPHCLPTIYSLNSIDKFALFILTFC